MSLTVIDRLQHCFTSVDALLDGLGPSHWATPSLCPDWTVRGVVGHLGGVEHMLLGAAPGSTADALPFARVGEWIRSTAELDDADFLARYREVVAGRTAELAAMTAAQLDEPSATPVGPGTYGRFMEIRVFDYWVHEQDMRLPLGLPGHEDGPAAETALDEVHRALPFIVGKRIGLPDGMSITFDLTGPVTRTMHAVVEGRARLAEAVGVADVTVCADSTTFMLLACGRIDPQTSIDAGRITWTGPDEWGDRAARHLAFTM